MEKVGHKLSLEILRGAVAFKFILSVFFVCDYLFLGFVSGF